MEKFNKKILIVFSFLVFLFLGLVLYMTYFQIAKAKDVSTGYGKYGQYNKRYWVDENKVKRGTVYDSQNNIVVETLKDSNGNNYRNFPFDDIYAPITGYSINGGSGLEKSFGKQLLNIKEDTPLSDLKKLVEKQDEGNNLVLTTNYKMQKVAMDLLENTEAKKGSIVAMNPKTGAIYAMASYPSFNPNKVAENWDEIIADNESAVLLNRATQGLYVPGSVFKVVTATSILENTDKVESLVIKDEGKIKIGGLEISNIENMVNNRTDLEKALVKSSNVYFAKLAAELGADILRETVDKYYIGKEFEFDLPMYKSKNGYVDGIDDANIATTSFGQGDTLVTPLNMAMVMSTIANEGKMMQPFIVDQIISPDGDITKTEPKVLSEVTTPEIANEILGDMVSVVRDGSKAYIRGIKVAGKSGTAEIKNKDSTNDWFIAAAPADDPTIAVAVVLEDSGIGGDKSAGPLAKVMIQNAINNGLGQ
ncbi:peptidoglycan D,D-transpeptidase FtsI family protein [Miniphocaeibacter halophilus]|uniref:Penicillin-binding protein 2 n=1 Tax=Miniphocaeibacter halophilus TaxID=2931922 RepID=A0AC61MNW0_9FIRM|nr:penicillin-binding protein 2 [Miniphocaeibacter halophilus]QQK07112.1 penicillin-binding protein 2 [Miniphocaeibacter halophilus]